MPTTPPVKPENKPDVKSEDKTNDRPEEAHQPIHNDPLSIDRELMDGPRVFNLNMLLTARGATKYRRLDETIDAYEQRRQGEAVTEGTNTSYEVADAIINRAGLPDSPLKLDLIRLFTEALNRIKDPVKWQNGQARFYEEKRNQTDNG